MRIRNNNPLDLIVAPNEAVTISIVRSTGLAASVNYSLNGSDFPGTKPKSEPCTFPVANHSNLAMTMHYVADEGGSFTIRTTGDGGGDVSEYSDTQAANTSFRTIAYRFTVQ